MALDIDIDRTIHRYDSELFPIVTITDATAAVIKISNWLYLPYIASPFAMRFPNRTMKVCPVVVRTMETQTFTLDAQITQVGASFVRDNTEGWNGAHYNTALSTVKCSIQGTPAAINKSTGISLQDGDVAITDNYNDVNAVHSIIFGQGGLASIRERGVLVPSNSHFHYEADDTALIELDNGIVRYYHIKKDTHEMRLIRATRSKLLAAPKAHVLLYSALAQLKNAYIFNNIEASTSIELVGVLENFQDWQNDFYWASTADVIQLANNDSEYTFANSKTRIRSITPNLNMRQKSERDDFLDFFLHHGIEEDFLFVDKAHTDRDKNATEFWSKFTAPFGDKARASCLSAHATQITESFRSDIVIREDDTGTLTVLLDSPPLSDYMAVAEFRGTWTHTQGGRLKEWDIYVDGVLYAEDVQNPDIHTSEYYIYIDTTLFANGSRNIYVIGRTFGGVSDQSNTIVANFNN